MSDPYAVAANYYDIMIDWPTRLARERPFFASLFDELPVGRALDVGCGTGHHARLFGELWADVVGLEPSRPMIDRARALTAGDNPRFVDGGFADISTLTGVFDLIAVLGNTLAYVADEAELRDVLRVMREKLAAGGCLVVQGVNYDSLGAIGSRWLPVIERHDAAHDYLFLREYHFRESIVEFTLITLIHSDGWQQHTECSRHFPITGDCLSRALLAAGFTQHELFGDYQRVPYDAATSPNLIALAR